MLLSYWTNLKYCKNLGAYKYGAYKRASNCAYLRKIKYATYIMFIHFSGSFLLYIIIK